MRPPRIPPAAAAAAALLALAGCAGLFEPPWAERLAASAAPPPVGAARAFDAPPPGSPAAARPPGLPAPGQVYVSPPPTPAQRDRAEVIAACRSQSEQIILQRDRGQLLREDERDVRIGASASLYDARSQLDRLGRQYAFGRMAEDCVDANRPPTPRR